jgi:hypothetical protein
MINLKLIRLGVVHFFRLRKFSLARAVHTFRALVR